VSQFYKLCIFRVLSFLIQGRIADSGIGVTHYIIDCKKDNVLIFSKSPPAYSFPDVTRIDSVYIP
jgi:hypothetical protein